MRDARAESSSKPYADATSPPPVNRQPCPKGREATLPFPLLTTAHQGCCLVAQHQVRPCGGEREHEELRYVVHWVFDGEVGREVAELGVPPASARRRARDLFGSAETPGARGYKTPMPTEMKNVALAADAVGLHIMR